MTTPRPAVVLVHGLWNTTSIFRYLQVYLEEQGWRVSAVSLFPNNGDISIEHQAHQLETFVNRQLGQQQPFFLVGFSMGGLVSRYYLQRLGPKPRVRRWIGVAVPHYGSRLAWLRWNIGGRQMQPGSRFLQELNREIGALRPYRPLSLWTPYDLLVLPPRHCCLPIGENLRLPVPGHNAMVRDERSLVAIARGLT